MSTENSVREDIVLALGSDYDIVRELGRGGASVVYLARDRVLGREVAIKVIRDSQTSDAEAVARFEREARTLAALQHPNIVMLYGARPLPGGSLALVMQHGEWSTLKTLIREQGPLPLNAVEQVLRDVASALIYLHRHHVIHRDIKPENIFIESETGRALLSDFGIAKSGDARTSVTLTGVVIGTPAYMSPEQIDGGELTGLSDLYSLGMVGYEMLTGVRPWDGESLFGVIYKQKTERLPPLLQRRPDTPEHLKVLIERATEKAPAARWQGAAEFLAALSGQGAAVAPVPASLPPRWAEPLAAAEAGGAGDYPTLEIEQALVDQAFAEGQRAQKRRQRLMAAAVIALLFSGGAGALAFSGRNPGETPAGGYGAASPDASVYGSEQQYTAAVEPLATDTPTFILEEPIVDSTPPPAPPQRLAERVNEPESRSVAADRTAAATVDREATPVQDRDTAVPAPATLLPSLSVVPRAASTRPPSAGPVVETRATQPQEAPVAAPRLRNRERIGQFLAERYPRDLRTRGIGGTTVLTVLVAPDGTVERSSMVTSSGNARLDEAASDVAARMVFEHPEGSPRQAVWVAVPLTFNPR